MTRPTKAEVVAVLAGSLVCGVVLAAEILPAREMLAVELLPEAASAAEDAGVRDHAGHWRHL